MSDQEKGRKLYCACLENNTAEAIFLINDPLTNVNWENPSGNTPLRWVCLKNNLEIFKALMSRGDILPNKANRTGSSPLHVACWNGHPDLVYFLASDSRTDVNKRDHNSTTPIWIASFREDITRILLSSSKRIDTRTASTLFNFRSTPAQQAQKNGLYKISELIGRYEINPEGVRTQLRKEFKITSSDSFTLSSF